MTAAEAEERAELELLRERADQTGREAAATLAELAARISNARDPGAIARRLTARARRGMLRAIHAMPANPAAKRAALATMPVLGVLTVTLVARRRGWLPPQPVIPNVPLLRRRRLPPPVPDIA